MHFILDQKNYWCGIEYINNPTQNLFKYKELVENIYPLQDVIYSSKYKSINLNFPELDFFEISSGKLPKNIYVTGGKLPHGFLINRSFYSDLIKLVTFAPHIKSHIKISYRKKLNEDYYYCFFKDITDNIDYENSIFRGYVLETNEYEYFKANSIQDLLIMSKEKYNFSTYFELVKFKPNSPQFDIFGLFYIDLNLYFSKKANEAFQKLKIKEEFKEAEVKFEY